MTVTIENASGRARVVVRHDSADEPAWIAAAVDAIEQALRSALAPGVEARLLLSGGTTPAPVYRALARRPLDWSRVRVGLVDERDVEPDADGSNARLIRETLLREAAAGARFEPLRGARQSVADAVRAANERWSAATNASPASSPRPDERCVAVLGMGDDGHTASLFPGAVNLSDALASAAAYVAVDATGCKVAGAYPHRISLTPAGLAQAGTRLLLLRGAGKRDVLDRALGSGPVADMPIRAVIDLPGAPLHVHWCP